MVVGEWGRPPEREPAFPLVRGPGTRHFGGAGSFRVDSRWSPASRQAIEVAAGESDWYRRRGKRLNWNRRYDFTLAAFVDKDVRALS